MEVRFDKKMDIESFADAFDDTAKNFSPKLKEKINAIDFSYRHPTNEENEKLYLEVLLKIESDKQKVGALERTKVWHDGWDENLKSFIDSNFDEAALDPSLLGKGIQFG